MSILTKEERAYKNQLTARAECGCESDEWVYQESDDIETWCEPCLADLASRALDTIDALEAHIGALEADLLQKRKIAGEWQGRAERRRGVLAYIDALLENERRDLTELQKEEAFFEQILDGIGEITGPAYDVFAGVTRLKNERDALKTDLHLWQKTSSSLHAQVEWMAGMTGRIKSIAKTNQNTHTIAWSHAALREILAVIEGGKSDDSIRRVTCKCINGGETTINWRTGCGETLCHAELIDEEEGDQ